jgi:hypothetical protein
MNRLVFVAIFLSSAFAWASEQVGTLTQLDGEVKLFSNPAKELQGSGPHALFEGQYYTVGDAKVGSRLEKGNILRTAPSGKARVVFDNGDQYNVGTSTAYKVAYEKDVADGKPSVDLMYGIVAKGGPRSKLQIRTKSATMGVRGTDFYIADGGPTGGTEVTVMRGEVEVKPVAAAASKATVPVTTVKPGFSGEVQLEKKALETTLNDVKSYDKKLYAKVDAAKLDGAEDVNRASVEALMSDAPAAAKNKKPFKSELEDLEKGAYDKYFKIVD